MSTPERLVADLPPVDTDRPAAADPLIKVQLDLLANRVKSSRQGLWLIVIVVVLVLGGAALTWIDQRPDAELLTVYGFAAALLGLGLALQVRAYRRISSWWAAALPALTERAWRPVPATVAGRDRLDPRDPALPGQLRLLGLREADLLVVARTGRVWVVGPDRPEPGAQLTVRLDGTPVLFPARLVRPEAGSAALAPRAAGTGTAADDPVTAALAAQATRTLNRWLVRAAVSAAVAIVFAVLLNPWIPAWFLLPVLLLPVVRSLLRWRRQRPFGSLPELLRAGPWTRVAVTLRPWLARPDGSAAATGTLQLAGGPTLEVELPMAMPELLGMIWRTGGVWLAGEPGPGRTVAVGFPGYPLLGLARLS